MPSPLHSAPHSLLPIRTPDIPPARPTSWRPSAAGWCRALMVTAACLLGSGLCQAQNAAELRARQQALAPALASSAFGRPIALVSTQTSERLEGDLVALVDHRFALLRDSLVDAGNWCQVVMLHLNVKGCTADADRTPVRLTMFIGSRHDQPLRSAERIDYVYRVASQGDDYLRIEMTAEQGPLRTRDYRVIVEATALDNRRSIVHLTYSYAYGALAKVAMQAYLATVGRGKVGFTPVSSPGDGGPDFVGGVRGTVERNVMRYFIALDAWLDGLDEPPARQLEARLRSWHQQAERYPRQLHDLDLAEYLTMKRHEFKRADNPP